ncbi:MAG: efflux RND transporter periplasmic adaptor subunit [Thermoguttaceae bacterium]
MYKRLSSLLLTCFLVLNVGPIVLGQGITADAAPPVVLPASQVNLSPSDSQPREGAREKLQREVRARKSAPFDSSFSNPNDSAQQSGNAASATYLTGGMETSRVPERLSELRDYRLLPTSEPLSATQELIRNAFVETEKQVVISAGTPGKLVELRVPKTDRRTGEPVLDEKGEPVMIEIKAGQMLHEGQVIGKINDDAEIGRINVANAALEIAQAERDAKLLEIEFAQATYQVAEADVEKNTILNKDVPNSVPHITVLEAVLRKIQARQQWRKAHQDYESIRPAEINAKLAELGIAENLLDQRKLYSPINGMVAEVWGAEGEWFREGKEILRIIRLDKLRIQGRVDGKRLTQEMVDNKLVTITAPKINGKQETFQGKVVYASPELLMDQHFLVHVEVDNRMENGYWLLSPGSFVELVIHLDKPFD